MDIPACRVHHITLRVSDLERSRRFYEQVLGLELDQALPGKYRFRLGPGRDSTRLVLHSPLPGTPDRDRFSEYRIGLDHIALNVHESSELRRLVTVLRSKGITTEGVQAVPGGGSLVSFRDPDNIQWEYFSNASLHEETET